MFSSVRQRLLLGGAIVVSIVAVLVGVSLWRRHECTARFLAAVQAGQMDVAAEMLSKGADVNARGSEGCTGLFLTAAKGDEEFTARLLSWGADSEARCTDGRAPLHEAAVRGHIEIAAQLLAHGAQTAPCDSSLETPLHLAAETCQPEIVALLLRNGADLSARDRFGHTPLHLAAFRQCENVVRVLLDAGADPNAADSYGSTPLHDAASGFGRGSPIVQLLAEAGADVNALDRDGRSPLRLAMACSHEDVARALLSLGARHDAFTAAASGNIEALKGLLARSVWEARQRDRFGRTPLHWAAEFGQAETARLLVEEGADPEAKDSEGRTPLALALTGKYELVAQILRDHGRTE